MSRTVESCRNDSSHSWALSKPEVILGQGVSTNVKDIFVFLLGGKRGLISAQTNKGFYCFFKLRSPDLVWCYLVEYVQLQINSVLQLNPFKNVQLFKKIIVLPPPPNLASQNSKQVVCSALVFHMCPFRFLRWYKWLGKADFVRPRKLTVFYFGRPVRFLL